MKATELEAKIASLIREHGDVDVVIDDADTNWWLAINQVEFIDGSVVISGDYHNSENPKRCQLIGKRANST